MLIFLIIAFCQPILTLKILTLTVIWIMSDFIIVWNFIRNLLLTKINLYNQYNNLPLRP